MRAILIAAFIALCPAFVAAQSNANPAAAQAAMDCRRLVPGQNNFIESDETVINGLACHVARAAVVASATAPRPVAAASKPAAAQPQATICFYRSSALVGAAIHSSIFIDGTNVGSLGRGKKFALTVSAGKHRIDSTAKGSRIDLDAKAGATYYVRLGLEVGFFRGHGAVTLMSPQQGEYEAAKMSEEATQRKQE